MSLYTGDGAHPGVAIAMAARLRVEYGVASFDPARLRRIALALRAFGVESPEPEQVILVADRLPAGPVPSSMGIEVVGLAVGAEPPPGFIPDVPAVFGLGDEFFNSVEENEIVIVDGSRGRVYVSPDAVTVARYQSPMVSARRIFLGERHLAARTQTDGRTVGVFVPAARMDDVDAAMDAGADGIFIPPQNEILSPAQHSVTAADQLAALDHVYRKVGGLPLLLGVPPLELALTALARGSARGALHLLLGHAEEQDALRADLTRVEAMLDEDDVPYGMTEFERTVTSVEESYSADALDGFAGIFLPEEALAAGMERLLPFAALARRASRPLTAALGDDWPSLLPTALSLGAARVVAPLDATESVKDAIRAW